ncbi:MAG: transaldolase [Myxococcales bacterium]|nr:transaldolase [Myxococcales bacterium]
MLFVDSSDPEEVRTIFSWGVVSGTTTNPMLLAKDGATDVEPRVRMLLAVSEGPVSVQVLGHEQGAMMDEAAALHEIDPARIVVKLPPTEAGLVTARKLASRGVHVNVTACMSFQQAYLAALTGARYVSVFWGRIRDMGYDATQVVGTIRTQLDREGLPAKIIAGSMRQPVDVTEALLAGSHVVTVTPPIFRKMLVHPKTEETLREFADAWAKRSK